MVEVVGKTLDQVTDMMVANAANLIITVKPANQRLTLQRPHHNRRLQHQHQQHQQQRPASANDDEDELDRDNAILGKQPIHRGQQREEEEEEDSDDDDEIKDLLNTTKTTTSNKNNKPPPMGK